MRHSYYASNGHAASGPRVDSAMQGETVRLTPTEIRIQREDATQHDSHDRNLAVELKGIVAAQRAISGEVDVGRLIETLLIVAVEHVGAERGLLFLARGSAHEIEAEATTHGGGVRVVFPPALATSSRFPESVLRYVIRTEESVVLDDASAENQFSDDDYVRSRHLRSILCLPLITQRELVGILYLENNLAPRAFAPDRLAVLELLASQAVASLSNARLYADLLHENTERRKAEEELERIRRMYGKVHLDGRAELMGGLTAALAHELNQPLGAIRSNAQAARRLLDAKKPDLEEVKAAIEDIVRDNSRAVDTVQNVRAIFQRDAVEVSSIDLGEILHDVGRIVTTEAALKGITVRLDLPSSLPTVIGNKNQLIQALMNLILNAFEAICENDDRGRKVEISARQREPGRVHIAVRDSGKGIDLEIMPRLFDAFFTTKPKGMGMGLAIVQSIIENHGGQLWATRHSDCGATIEFELPVEPHHHDRTTQ
jgi:signal transduction histidine kinase